MQVRGRGGGQGVGRGRGWGDPLPEDTGNRPRIAGFGVSTLPVSQRGRPDTAWTPPAAADTLSRPRRASPARGLARISLLD